jgi:subtilase family serine protease
VRAKLARPVLAAGAAVLALCLACGALVPGALAGPRPRRAHAPALGARRTRAVRVHAATIDGLEIQRLPTPAGITSSEAAPTPLPSTATQIGTLAAALKKMKKDYAEYAGFYPGVSDVFDYNVGPLWLKGIDGAGTTVAVIEGWDDRNIAGQVAAFDKPLGLPNPQITTMYPSGDGKLPAKCPPGMVALGGYGSCQAWEGELQLDVESAHLMAPYAKILISVTPADSQITDDAASQVAPPEMMQALEAISKNHLANVLSISDGTGESSYSHGAAEITAQNMGELTAAAAGIPLIVATGDTGVVQALPSPNGSRLTSTPSTATWSDSPWATAVGGSAPNLSSTGKRLGPDPLWRADGTYSEGAGYSSVYLRPSYQSDVAGITGSPMRSVPDITMDARDGTSEAAPLFAGILSLATEMNKGNVGPINPVLYGVLGPQGSADGISDVVSGNNSLYNASGHVLVPGFSAGKGFDVASGWGTIYAPRFVPSLVAATKATDQDKVSRDQAEAQLTLLEHAVTFSPDNVAPTSMSYMLAHGFLPEHPVKLVIDNHLVATVYASVLGTVDYAIDPALLKLASGTHTVMLKSMLVDVSGTFVST